MKSVFSLLIGLALSLHLSRGAAAAGTNLELFSGKKWTFYPGYEFPGAKGSLRLEKVDDKDALIVAYDFSGGGAYVAAKTPLEILEGATALRFNVKADRKHKLVLRLVDSTKQTLQWELRYDQPDQWQQVEIPLAGPVKAHFGGQNDGVIHFPVVELSVGVAKSGLGSAGAPGEVSMAEAYLDK
ncbi:hypothetical protein BH09VER1_BH09VER1_03830 [soil metagenome]